MSPKILLFGSGAIGTIYVYLLDRAGYDVTAVCRSNYDVAKREGFLIDSERYGNGIKFQPKVVRTPAEAAEAEGSFDYVIVCSKAIPDVETSRIIEPAVTQGKTTIALIQNGVGIEEEFAQRFPENPLLSCVVYLPSTQIKPGHMQMGTFEWLEIGTFPSAAYKDKSYVKEATDTFVKIMQDASNKATFYEDVQEKRWQKLIVNASWNPICALTLSRDVAYLASSEAAEQLVEATMLEIVSIAQKLGHTSVTPETASMQLKRARDRIGGKGMEPSMLVDVLNGRRMEVESILGNAMRLGKSLNVAVPRLELLYALLKALDESAMLRQPGQSLGGDETRTERSKKDEKAAL